MGHVRRVLTKREIGARSDIYPDFHSIERAEEFHIHWRNVRLCLNQEEFVDFCGSCARALDAWREKGSPPPDPSKSLPEYLLLKTVNPVHGRRPCDFAIEEQHLMPWMPTDMIHFHYKSLRIDLSSKEFVEIAELFQEALRVFREEKL